MQNEQDTAKGETFVMEEDPSRKGYYRPLAIRRGDERSSRNRGGWSSNRSYYQPRSNSKFGTYRGYIPYWYRDLKEHQWDRWKLIGITALVSPVLLAKLPMLLKFLVQP